MKQAPGPDYRKEPRRRADGAVQVSFANPGKQEIRGRLIDVSASGFRMAHDFTALGAGQSVDFSHTEASGKARVVWTRISEAGVETGFLVVS